MKVRDIVVEEREGNVFGGKKGRYSKRFQFKFRACCRFQHSLGELHGVPELVRVDRQNPGETSAIGGDPSQQRGDRARGNVPHYLSLTCLL